MDENLKNVYPLLTALKDNRAVSLTKESQEKLDYILNAIHQQNPEIAFEFIKSVPQSLWEKIEAYNVNEVYKALDKLWKSDVVLQNRNVLPQLYGVYYGLRGKLLERGINPDEVAKDKNVATKTWEVITNTLQLPANVVAKITQSFVGGGETTPVRLWGGSWGDVVQGKELEADEGLKRILYKKAANLPLTEEEEKKYKDFSGKRFWLGLAGDVVLDPLNVIGAGVKAIAALGKGAKIVKSGAVGAEVGEIVNAAVKSGKAIAEAQNAIDTAKKIEQVGNDVLDIAKNKYLQSLAKIKSQKLSDAKKITKQLIKTAKNTDDITEVSVKAQELLQALEKIQTDALKKETAFVVKNAKLLLQDLKDPIFASKKALESVKEIAKQNLPKTKITQKYLNNILQAEKRIDELVSLQKKIDSPSVKTALALYEGGEKVAKVAGETVKAIKNLPVIKGVAKTMRRLFIADNPEIFNEAVKTAKSAKAVSEAIGKKYVTLLNNEIQKIAKATNKSQDDVAKEITQMLETKRFSEIPNEYINAVRLARDAFKHLFINEYLNNTKYRSFVYSVVKESGGDDKKAIVSFPKELRLALKRLENLKKVNKENSFLFERAYADAMQALDKVQADRLNRLVDEINEGGEAVDYIYHLLTPEAKIVLESQGLIRGTGAGDFMRQRNIKTIQSGGRKLAEDLGIKGNAFEQDVRKILAVRAQKSAYTVFTRDIKKAAIDIATTQKREGYVAINNILGATDIKQTLYVPREVAEYLQRLLNPKQFTKDTETFLNIYDTVTSLIKGFLTTFRIYVGDIAFFTRNMVGNVYNSLLSNVSKTSYIKAWAFLLSDEMATITTKNGRVYTKQEILELAQKHNAVNGGIVNEIVQDIKKATEELRKIKEKGNIAKVTTGLANAFAKAAEKSGKLNEAIEIQSKMALFIAHLIDGNTAQRAAEITRKYLFDYNELTAFEKGVMKRIVLFYTWLRKNIPLQLEHFVTPKVITNLPLRLSTKTLRAVQEKEREEVVDTGALTGFLEDTNPIILYKNPETRKAVMFMSEGLLPQFDVNEIIRFFNNPIKFFTKNLTPIIANVIGLVFSINPRTGAKVDEDMLPKETFMNYLRLFSPIYKIVSIYQSQTGKKFLDPVFKRIQTAPEREFLEIALSWLIGRPLTYEQNFAYKVKSSKEMNKLNTKMNNYIYSLRKKREAYSGEEYPFNDMQDDGQELLKFYDAVVDAYKNGYINKKSMTISVFKRAVKEFLQNHGAFYTKYKSGGEK